MTVADDVLVFEVEPDILVDLSWEEVAQGGALAGMRRQVRNLVEGRADAYGFRGDPWGTHINGALAEQAFAKWRNRYWSGAWQGTRDDDDVGGTQIKSSTFQDAPLRTHRKDPDDRAFVLMVGPTRTATGVRFRVAGWAYGRETKRDDWERTPRPGGTCYEMPQDELRPMSELPANR